MFASKGFWLVAVLEVVVIRGGTGLLDAVGGRDYIIAWVAGVVGVHFVAFGRLFWPGFYWLGAALVAAGIAGTVVGLAGGGGAGIQVTAGLMAAVSLFAAGGWTVVTTRAGAQA